MSTTKSRLLLSFLVAIGLTACAGLKYIPPTTSITGIDFTPYTAQGFMITPEMYRGDYESVGVINVIMHAEGRLETDPKTGITGWHFSTLHVDDVVKEAHQRAVAMGADAIVNFDVKAAPEVVQTVVVPGIEATGFAIKRKSSVR